MVSAKYLENLYAYMTEEIDLIECEYRVTRTVFDTLKELENPQIVFEGNSGQSVIKSCNYGLSYSPIC